MSAGITSWAATPGGRKILAEARRRLEAGSALARGNLRVELTAAERRDVGALLGVAWEASGTEPPVAVLHKALEARGTTLRALLERAGPIRDLRGERSAARAAVADERDRSIAILTGVGIGAEAATWAMTRRGLPKAGSGKLIGVAEAAALAWQKKPGLDAAPVQLPVLAGDLFNNTHALDRDTDVGRTVARLAAISPDTDLAAVDITAVAQWRAAWARIGVLCDTVSSLVLTLNLHLTGLAPAVALTAVAGEPVWLSLRSLTGTWSAAAGHVWVCENPAIVEAAADRLGATCPPLVCTYGQPSMAALTLLRGVHAAGCIVHVRADDDPAGQAIVTQLLRVAPDAQLWRYARRSATSAGESPRYEEQVLEELLGDLVTHA